MLEPVEVQNSETARINSILMKSLGPYRQRDVESLNLSKQLGMSGRIQFLEVSKFYFILQRQSKE